MTVTMREAAESDLAEAFHHYETSKVGLGEEFIDEFRRAIDRILQFPHAWHALDDVFRRCSLRRFPYGIIYHVDDARNEIVISAVVHLQREPGSWRDRG